MSGDQFDADRRGRLQTGGGPWYGPGPRALPGEMAEDPDRPFPAPEIAGGATVMETIHADICALAARANLSVERIEGAANRALGAPDRQVGGTTSSDASSGDMPSAARSIEADLEYLSFIVARLDAAADRIERIV